MRHSQEFDHNIVRDFSPLDFATDLFGQRFTIALFATSEMMTRRDIGSHGLPDIPGLAVET
jgi:hypothetical protein